MGIDEYWLMREQMAHVSLIISDFKKSNVPNKEELIKKQEEEYLRIREEMIILLENRIKENNSKRRGKRK